MLWPTLQPKIGQSFFCIHGLKNYIEDSDSVHTYVVSVLTSTDFRHGWAMRTVFWTFFQHALTLNVRGPSFLDLTRSIRWLLMPWLLMSPGHQQPWYWLCRISRSGLTWGRILTHWGRDKLDAISQTTFSNVFSWMKMFEFRLEFHWSMFPSDWITIIQHWFRWWLGAVQATSHYLNQWWLVYRRIYASFGLNELSTCVI